MASSINFLAHKQDAEINSKAEPATSRIIEAQSEPTQRPEVVDKSRLLDKMKLKRGPNRRMPANRWATGAHLLISFPLLLLMQLQTIEAITAQAAANQTLSKFDVMNLRLTSDFRAVKLRWTYEHQAEAFDVRYCELTSWNIEIKCRTRELPVIKHNSSVIGDVVRQLEPPAGNDYEAQVYDLRALTNYTFQVRASQPMAEESPAGASVRLGADQRKQRRLDDTTPTARQVETKAFGAEATKCLANASEVVINTGRYFGGRISVEDSSNPRCHLLGNRSSEQTTYTFRIDHEICQSRVTNDDHRIETMILVHENKDILTHNTARFLVLCNFQQKSFTLKASVSLAKVNGQLQGDKIRPVKPAVITALQDSPAGGGGGSARNEVASALASEPHATAVMLGSMPGLYRARSSQSQLDANGADELEPLSSNTIERDKFKQSRNESQPNRRAKELAARHPLASSARSLALEDSGDHLMAPLTQQLKPPEPVQVQSKVLYVERSLESRNARRRNNHNGVQQHLLESASLMQSSLPAAASVSLPSVTKPMPATTSRRPVQLDSSAASARFQRQSSTPDELAEVFAPPVIITNNHRVSADYPPLTTRANNDSQLSFRYSAAAKLAEEIPLEQHVAGGARAGKLRSRVARMRLVDDDADQAPSASINRMGETQPEQFADQMIDSANEPLVNSTLARNITSYLLKWSLKTLTNLARKSLESLAKQDEQELTNVGSGESSLLVSTASPALERSRTAANLTRDTAGSDSTLSGSSIKRDQRHNETTPKLPSNQTSARDNRTRAPNERTGRTGRIKLNTDQPLESTAASWIERTQADSHSYGSPWLLYGTCAFISVIAGVLLTLWLLASSSAHRREQAGRAETITSGDPGVNPRDKFESFRSDTLSGRALLTASSTGSPCSAGKTSPSSASSSSRSTSSTSVGSTSALGDENDCKNQEFLFTEHVLINTGSSFGESFA